MVSNEGGEAYLKVETIEKRRHGRHEKPLE